MSAFTDFCKAGNETARAVIGGHTLAIGGGTAVVCTLGTVNDSRGFESGGYEAETELEAVVLAETFEAVYTSGIRTYLGKTAVSDGRTYRIVNIRHRDPLYVIELGSSERGA